MVIDGGGREVRSSGECVPFARRPVLFEVLRVLAEAWPDAVPRDVLIARAFGARGVRIDAAFRGCAPSG